MLELADAGDLGKLIQHFKSQNKKLPEKTVWKYFVQVANVIFCLNCRLWIMRILIE